MKTILKLLLIVVNLFLLLLLVAIIRTITLPKPKPPLPCLSGDEDYVDENRGVSKRLSEAIRFPTISFKPHTYNESSLRSFLGFIKSSFPLIHSSPLVTREVINNLSLLYHVQGSNPSLKPYLLAGHMDVVPVNPDAWEVPPFSGLLKDGYIWGRGTIDCKHVVMGSLEALEFLLSKQFKFQRSFYLAFGHDEEVHGLDGARHIAKVLKSRNVVLEYLLDEGTIILDNIVPTIKSPIAFIGISEKGALDIKMSVQGTPGHASLPTKETSIVTLAKAISKLEGDVFPSMFGQGPERKMIEELAYCAPFPLKFVMSNIWLFKPLIPLFMKSKTMSAFHRTTTAVTLISGGDKINVLPGLATASANLRVHPAQSISEAVDYLKRIINDDRIELEVINETPPHPVSPIDTFGYYMLKKTIEQIKNDTCVVPTTLIANTDTRWYLDLTNSIYRFSFVHILPADIARFHGNNERIGEKNYLDLVNFFVHLMKNSDAHELPAKHAHQDL